MSEYLPFIDYILALFLAFQSPVAGVLFLIAAPGFVRVGMDDLLVRVGMFIFTQAIVFVRNLSPKE